MKRECKHARLSMKVFLTVRELDDPDRVSNGCNTTRLEHRQADRSEPDNSEISLSLLK